MSILRTTSGRKLLASKDPIVRALNQSRAMIEFTAEGTILDANENFLRAVGYTLAEIQGKHHSMFMPAGSAGTAEYQAFWRELGQGKHFSALFRRIGKGGNEIWLQASYNPIIGRGNRVERVIKVAVDVTAQTLANADYLGQVKAIGRSQAVIEFDPTGTILTANENFLKTMGYTLDEVKGRHHRMFMDRDESETSKYAAFWESLRRGEFHAGQFKRNAKGGREVWLQASYNPIMTPTAGSSKS